MMFLSFKVTQQKYSLTNGGGFDDDDDDDDDDNDEDDDDDDEDDYDDDWWWWWFTIGSNPYKKNTNVHVNQEFWPNSIKFLGWRCHDLKKGVYNFPKHKLTRNFPNGAKVTNWLVISTRDEPHGKK